MVIAGAGIGGLATCLALRRVGVDAHVYERALVMKADAGTAIAIWPNGMKALRAIGSDVEAEVTERGAKITGMTLGMVDDTLAGDTQAEVVPGKEVGAGELSQGVRTAPDSNADTSFLAVAKQKLSAAAMKAMSKAFPVVLRAKHGAGLVCIRWASVQGALASFLPEHVIHLDASIVGTKVVEFRDGTFGVAVEFEKRDGSPYADDGPVIADVLIGADGINSKVREFVLKDGRPRDNGRVIWRGVVNASKVAASFAENATGTENETNTAYPVFCPEKATVLSASKDSTIGRTTCFMDVGGGQLYWAAGCLDESIVASGDDSVHKNPDKGNCAATFAGYPDVLACLQNTDDVSLYTSRVLDRAPMGVGALQKALRGVMGDTELMPSQTAPISLLGDAAHPVIPSFGQGGNLALEDSVEIALALMGCDRATAPAALRKWETARLERTVEAQIASFLSGSKSYGDEKLKAALEESGLTKETIDKHKARFPDFNKTNDWLLAWVPSCGTAQLAELAPGRAMALARRAASDAKPSGIGGPGDEFGSNKLAGFLVGAGLSTLLSLSGIDCPPALASTYTGDGFTFETPLGWRIEERPGVSSGKTELFAEGVATAPVATLSREPTFTMGAQGLDSLYGTSEFFGEKVAGARRGELVVSRQTTAGDAFIAEGTAYDNDGKTEKWIELVSVHCRSGENARKYNLSQTVKLTAATHDDAAFQAVVEIANSFALTGGKTCAAGQ